MVTAALRRSRGKKERSCWLQSPLTLSPPTTWCQVSTVWNTWPMLASRTVSSTFWRTDTTTIETYSICCNNRFYYKYTSLEDNHEHSDILRWWGWRSGDDSLLDCSSHNYFVPCGTFYYFTIFRSSPLNICTLDPGQETNNISWMTSVRYDLVIQCLGCS